MEDLKSFNLDVSDEVFSLFSELIYKTSGIKLTFVKKGLLISRLLRRIKLLDIKSFHEYYQRVNNDNEELVEMLNCISTHTTMFFRENYHFEYLKNNVIPELRKNKQEKTLRIWSAGCSTGEEPYSIAISVLEALRQSQGMTYKRHTVYNGLYEGQRGVGCSTPARSQDWNIKILATDISTNVLDVAQAGIYEHEQLPYDFPEKSVGRYFLKGIKENEGKLQVKDFLKETVRFRRLNLKDTDYPFKKEFDAIFCRNVMIYFDEDMRRHLLSMFYHFLSDGGHIFLGHSETMIGKEKFKPVYITVYKKM